MGQEIYYDELTGQFFRSSKEDIRKACERLDSIAKDATDGLVTLDDYCNCFGMKNTDCGGIVSIRIGS